MLQQILLCSFRTSAPKQGSVLARFTLALFMVLRVSFAADAEKLEVQLQHEK